MQSIAEQDLGTPARASETQVKLLIDGCEISVPAGTSVMRAAALADLKIPKLCATDQLEAFGSCRIVPGADRGHEGVSGLLHHAGGRGNEGHHAEPRTRAAAPRGHGAVHLRPSARLPDLPGQRALRIAGHGRRGGPARGALRLRGRQSPGCAEGRVQSLFHLRCQQVHRLFALRARLRRAAGHAGPDHCRARLRLGGLGQPGRVVHGFRVRVLRRLRAGLPDRDAVREIADRAGPGRAQRGDHLRLLWRRLLVPCRDARRGTDSHGAEQGRARQSRPQLRQGPLRDRLRYPPGSHHQADDPRARSPNRGAR